jgi:phytanoyl-CoA hydroxylase
MSLEQNFREQGFAVLPELITARELASIRRAARRIVDDFDIGRYQTVFSTSNQEHAEDSYFLESAEAVHCFLEEDALDARGRPHQPKELAINKLGHALHDLVPEFSDFCRLPQFREVLRTIGYDRALLWQTMYIFKQAGIGGEVRWHQDASYLITQPSSIVGFWVAIEDAHRGNGCLWVQPGGHRSPLREIYEVEHRTGEGRLRTLDTTPWPGESQAVPVEVPAGSLVIFSDHLPHYSSKNQSDSSRHAFTMHFASPDSAWSRKNWLQRDNLDPFLV